MIKGGARRGAAVFLLLHAAVSVEAHHSAGMFDFAAPVWLEAVFVSYEHVNPHSILTLHETTEDGRIVEWTIEGQSVFQSQRRGFELGLEPGDVVRICGFALKGQFASLRPQMFLHGYLLAMPNGEKRPWGPYGRFPECMRGLEDAEAASWIAMLGTERWCRQQDGAPLSADAEAVVERINAQMGHPCQ